MSDVCPHCGQRMLIRYGVQLSPKLADIFDMIEKRPMDTETLAWLFYPDRSKKEGQRCVAVNIYHINDRFMSTDIRIKMEGRFGCYRVENGSG